MTAKDMPLDAVPVKTPAGLAALLRGDRGLGDEARALLIAVCGDLCVRRLKQRLGDAIDVEGALRELEAAGLVAYRREGEDAAPGLPETPELRQARALMAAVPAAPAPAPEGRDAYLHALAACASLEQVRGLLPVYRELLASALGTSSALVQAARVAVLLGAPPAPSRRARRGA